MSNQAPNKGGPGSAFWLKQDKIARLKAAFSKNANVVEVCFYARISRSSYYAYKQKNPDKAEQWENKSLALHLKAKTSIADQKSGCISRGCRAANSYTAPVLIFIRKSTISC